MNTLLIFVAATMMQDLPTWLPARLHSESEFETTFVDAKKTHASLLERATGRSVLLQVRTSSPTFASKPIVMSAVSRDVRETTSSGLPFGHQVRILVKPGSVSYMVVGNFEQVTVRFFGARVYSNGRRQPPSGDLSQLEPLVESLAREAMGKFASRRAGPVTDRQIAGAAVKSFVAADTSAVMVDLAGWAQANNVSLNVNSEAHRASFSWRGKTHIVALATDQIKVGGEWRPMTDIVVMHQDKMWVPLSALD